VVAQPCGPTPGVPWQDVHTSLAWPQQQQPQLQQQPSLSLPLQPQLQQQPSLSLPLQPQLQQQPSLSLPLQQQLQQQPSLSLPLQQQLQQLQLPSQQQQQWGSAAQDWAPAAGLAPAVPCTEPLRTLAPPSLGRYTPYARSELPCSMAPPTAAPLPGRDGSSRGMRAGPQRRTPGSWSRPAPSALPPPGVALSHPYAERRARHTSDSSACAAGPCPGSCCTTCGLPRRPPSPIPLPMPCSGVRSALAGVSPAAAALVADVRAALLAQRAARPSPPGTADIEDALLAAAGGGLGVAAATGGSWRREAPGSGGLGHVRAATASAGVRRVLSGGKGCGAEVEGEAPPAAAGGSPGKARAASGAGGASGPPPPSSCATPAQSSGSIPMPATYRIGRALLSGRRAAAPVAGGAGQSHRLGHGRGTAP
jgi:hypothetical protein